MLHLLVKLIIAITVLSVQNISYSKTEFKPCVLDRKLLFQESNAAKKLSKKFQYIRQSIELKYREKYTELDTEVQTLKKNTPYLKPHEINAHLDKIKHYQKMLAIEIENVNNRLIQLDIQITNSFAEISTPPIRAILEGQQCSLLISKETLLSVADESLDITQKVLDLMNENTNS
ncbi:OmpH family outer membrane protein [uncultured Legionella sp.]|uniref:OmpH family outer membrane protein n=1 Tax=uncultured Legionella sp. TaxID=210934 RepID=UPI0026126708|nr:OmpH family outer membrane protein [uncultured Legionella sp.]